MDRARKSQAAKAPTSAPSGIAQLRKSIDLSAEQNADPMNLDDFLVPTSIASPAGISPAPMPDLSASQNPHSAVPLNMREKPHINIPTGMPASSVPKSSIPTMRGGGEFDYVQKRVRKTSIDERRVRLICPIMPMPSFICIFLLVLLGSYLFPSSLLLILADRTFPHCPWYSATLLHMLIPNRTGNDQPNFRPRCLR